MLEASSGPAIELTSKGIRYSEIRRNVETFLEPVKQIIPHYIIIPCTRLVALGECDKNRKKCVGRRSQSSCKDGGC